MKSAVPGGDVTAGSDFRKLIYRGIAVYILSFIFFALFARIGIDPHHDGVMMIPALEVAKGNVVFRDVFCQYGLLVPLLQGLAVALFGAELIVIRLLTVFFYAGSAVLLDLLWRRFLPAKLSYFTPVLFCLISSCTMVTFHSWNSAYALFFMLLSAYFLLRYFESGKSWWCWLLFSGISAGLTWGSRTPCGVVTFFAAVLILLGLNWFTGKSRRRVIFEAGIFAGGGLLIALSALMYILFTGSWSDFINQNFAYAVNFAHQRGGGGSWQYFCDCLFPFYQEEFWYCNAFFALMPLGAMVMLYFAVRRGFLEGRDEMKKQLPFAALLIIGLGSWHQYYPVPCVRHLFWGGAPLLGAYLLMLYRLFVRRNFAGKLGALILVVVLLLAFYPRFWGIFNRLEFNERQASTVPGIRGIRLNNYERGIVDMVDIANKLPAPLLRNGVVNWSESSLFTLMLPRSGFKDRQFYRGDFYPYPDYDQKVAEYILLHRCPVLVDHDVMLPGYLVVAEKEYMGNNFRLLIPEEFLLKQGYR